ncbi:MAG: efflux RND transporter periplasmic adaptor subunit [Acidobacteriota bacterium]
MRTRNIAFVTVTIVVAAIAIALAIGIGSWSGGGAAPAAAKYRCPMHPTYVADAPGDCPICGMRLVPMSEEGAADPEETAAAPGSGAGGLAQVTVTPEGMRLAGIRTEAATRQRLGRTVRTVGLVVPDETRIRHVHTKLPGWIDRLYVNFTGQQVKAGEPILAIYSPELLASQEEYLRTRESVARLGTSGLAEVQRGREELLRAARRRLELFDVPASFIAQIERTGKAQRTVTLEAPASGFVTAKDVFQGQQIEPGMELYAITDLARVWIDAAFYEFEARSLSVGQEAHLTLPFDPGVERSGRISYIYPYLDAESRTLRARLEVDNADLSLRPAMYANVEIEVDSMETIVVPDSAVMDTGERQVVFVETATGTFDPREVKVGSRSAGMAQILAGVAEDERVVTHANFLLDSESRLRAISGAGEAHSHGGSDR